MKGFCVTVLLAVSLYTLVSCDYITFNHGGRANKLFFPTTYDPNESKQYPLFVILHGCTQDPDQISTGSKMNIYGEQHEFFVLYPLQPLTANINKCWNWFEINHQARGSGEPAFIVGATNAVAAAYNIDREAIFVAGLSAGAAMTAILGATYPDVFSGLGIAAGLEFKAATSVLNAFTAMRSGGPPPRTQGALAWSVMSPNFKAPLEVIVAQGSSDFTVYPINGDQATEQWVWANDFALGGNRLSIEPTSTIPGQAPNGGRTYTEYQYADTETGIILGRYFYVDGMGHAWSGGAATGSYTDPRGPDFSLLMIQWFLQGFDHNSRNMQNGTLVQN